MNDRADVGVQAFDYRGSAEVSTPGKVVVLHPDEPHDGRAGTRDGFGYRVVYFAPAHVQAAARALRGRPGPLPFVREPVRVNRSLAGAIEAAFRHGGEPLAVDSLIACLTEALLEADPSSHGGARPMRVDAGALARARRLLDAETARVVRSGSSSPPSALRRRDTGRSRGSVHLDRATVERRGGGR